MIHPDPLYRHRILQVGECQELGTEAVKYEVLEEMYEMWNQAHLAAEAEAGEAWDATSPNAVPRMNNLQRLVTTREVWEQAIMVYTGWTGAELQRWLAKQAFPHA